MKTSFIDKIFTKVIHYYSHDYYRLTLNGFVPLDKVNSIKILIVARQHYLERKIILPITLKKDVKSALAFELLGLEKDFHIFYRIQGIVDGSTHIELWQIPRELIPSSAFMVLPESYILSQTLQPGEILSFSHLSGIKSTFIAKTQGGFVSLVDIKKNITVFSQAAAVKLDRLQQLKHDELPSRLFHGIRLSLASIAFSFYCKHDKHRDIQERVKPLLLPISSLFVVYLLASSVFIWGRHQLVSSQVIQQKQDIDNVLMLQTELAELTAELEKFSSLGQDKKPLWKIWPVLAPLFEQNVTFRFIRFNGEQFFISANASSASDVLEYLLDRPEIFSASFTAAVRKVSDQEQFIIKLSLNDSLLKNQGENNEK